MKIETLKQEDIKSLVGNQSSFYFIPDYQRPYSWEEENISDFWQDISKSYENDNGSYFLGSFILIKQKDAGRFEVVDGQQRLTTITIFLAVLRDYFQESGETELAQKIQNEFLKKDGIERLSVPDVEKIKFDDVVLSGVGSLVNHVSVRLGAHYVNAIKNLRQHIADKKSEGVANDYFKKLYEYFLNEVFVIVVVTEDIASAYTIFETINNRGKELLVQDLLKNYLLKKIQDEVAVYNRRTEGMLMDFEEKRKTFVATWQSLADKKYDLTDMLNYHYSVIGGSKKRTDLFKEITNHIRDNNLTASDFMLGWQKTIEAFDSLKQQSGLSDSAYKNLLSLEQLNHKYWVPVLISAKLSSMSQVDFEAMLFEIEKMYAMYWVAGYNSVKMKYSTWTLIKDYINAGKDVGEIRKYIKKNMVRDRVNRWFSLELNDECYKKSWCRYVLAKYEYSLTDDTMTKKFNFDKIQIEHILPQTMDDDYWRSRFTEEQHSELVNRIGNLTLLAGGIKEAKKSKNQSASNKPYPDKLKIYKGETLKDGVSALNMTRELDIFKDWTVDAITARQKQVVGKLMEVWQISSDEINNEEAMIAGVVGENEYTEEELKKIDQYREFLENRYHVTFLKRGENDRVCGRDMSRKKCVESWYDFIGAESLYMDDKYGEEGFIPVIDFFKGSVEDGEHGLALQIMNDEAYLPVIAHIFKKPEFSGWNLWDDKRWMYINIDLDDSQKINSELVKVYEALLELRNNHQPEEFYEYSKTETNSGSRQQNEEIFLGEAGETLESDELEAVKKIIEFSKDNADQLVWGRGTSRSSLNPRFSKTGSTKSLYTIRSNGDLSVNFGWLNDCAEAERCRDNFKDMLSKGKILDIQPDYVTHFPRYKADVWCNKVDLFTNAVKELLNL